MLGLEASACALSSVMPGEPTNPPGEPASSFFRHKEGRVHVQGIAEVAVSPRAVGIQQSSTVGSTLWGMASGVVVVLGIVLDLAEIAPASCQPQQTVWSSL